MNQENTSESLSVDNANSTQSNEVAQSDQNNSSQLSYEERFNRLEKMIKERDEELERMSNIIEKQNKQVEEYERELIKVSGSPPESLPPSNPIEMWEKNYYNGVRHAFDEIEKRGIGFKKDGRIKAEEIAKMFGPQFDRLFNQQNGY